MIAVPLEHAHAVVNGVRLQYVTAGSAKRGTVVLLHGFPSFWFCWRRVIPQLVAEGFSVVAPDIRGFGNSDRPLSGYDKRTLATDVLELLNALDVSVVHVVGHDFGGQIGVRLAYLAPERVRSLSVIESLMPGLGHEAALDMRQSLRFWFYALHMAPGDIADTLLSGHERTYIRELIYSFVVDRAAFGDADVEEYAQSFERPGAMRAGSELYRTMPADIEDFAPLLKTPLPIPVLALGGENSMGSLVGELNRPLSLDIRSGVIAQAGHFLPEEKPDEVATHLLELFTHAETRSGRSTPRTN